MAGQSDQAETDKAAAQLLSIYSYPTRNNQICSSSQDPTVQIEGLTREESARLEMAQRNEIPPGLHSVSEPGSTYTSNAISIEEFEAEAAAVLASVRARNASKPQARAKSAPQPVPIAAKPVPLGAAPVNTSTEYISKVNDLCHALALEHPVYDIRETSKNQQFTAKATVAGKDFSDESTFPNKKEAKANIARQLCDYLENSGLTRPQPTAKEGEENFVGMLGEFAQATSSAPISYQYFELGRTYSCEATFTAYPDQVFGNREEAFPSKKAAKTNSAKKAIEYLRTQGLIGEKVPTKKEMKATLNANNKRPRSPSDLDMEDTATGPSTAEQALTLAIELGIDGPFSYALTQPNKESAPDFWDCYVTFPKDRQMPKDGIGAVRNIRGKKNAKEECAKGVLEFLEDLKAERLRKRKERLGF